MSRSWVMAQRWHDLLFMHWPVEARVLRGGIPAGLELDTRDGEAWLGVVPFRMTGIRFRVLPPLPGLSAFPELNVRTYVVRDGEPGVWFFSLDAGNAVAVTAARLWFHLPYYRARMRLSGGDGGAVRYESARTHRGAPRAEFRARYRPTGDAYAASPGGLDHWLTERYCLFAADRRGRLYRGEVRHDPWPLQPAEVDVEANTMSAFALPDVPPLLHFARRLDVVVGAPRAIAPPAS